MANVFQDFWKLNVGQLLTMVVVCAGAYGAWVTQGAEQTRLRNDFLELQRQISRMDEAGTHASSAGIKLEAAAIEDENRRVTELERVWHDAGPKLERISVNVDLIRAQLDRKP